jgi:hypothetical protein
MVRTALCLALGLAVVVAAPHPALAQMAADVSASTASTSSAVPASRSGLGLGLPSPRAQTASADAAAPSAASTWVLPTGGSASAMPSAGLVAQVPATPAAPALPAAPAACSPPVEPYKNYACLDAYLGDNVFQRLVNYYKLEWGQPGPPTDPNAPPGRRDYWPATPETTPPMPFTEWPYGGVTPFGVTRTGSVDSPLMAAIANTGVGHWLNDAGIQVYGWIDPGFNISSSHVQPGGNAPAAYMYTPNTVQLDQAVLYIDRFPDTVQKDHLDWGMRISALYGENYRYTTSYGLFSDQFLKQNNINGYDLPMIYGELFDPFVLEGLMVRVGRYISLPDIEAQLAPNNYMYSHSLTYAYDNYTNEGIQASLAVTPQLMVQLGVSVGTEAVVWHWDKTKPNPFPNPLYPGTTMPTDPGATPSVTACFRYTWNNGNDNIYPCVDALNDGNWGYNNLQWHGLTYYHKFNDQWHISYEFYDEWQNRVPNALNPTVQTIVANGGTPFASLRANSPNLAQCKNSAVLDCQASAIGTTAYINYSPDPLNNFSFRPEFYDDMEGQRTGVKTRYVDFGIGWQHWLSPQIEFRPEIVYYRSLDANAFNGNANKGIAPDRSFALIGAMDMIFHF